jgi:hypothetical protein
MSIDLSRRLDELAAASAESAADEESTASTDQIVEQLDAQAEASAELHRKLDELLAAPSAAAATPASDEISESLAQRLDAQAETSAELRRKLDEVIAAITLAASAESTSDDLPEAFTRQLDDHAQMLLETMQSNTEALHQHLGAQRNEGGTANAELHRKLDELAAVVATTAAASAATSSGPELGALQEQVAALQSHLETQQIERYEATGELHRKLDELAATASVKPLYEQIAELQAQLDMQHRDRIDGTSELQRKLDELAAMTSVNPVYEQIVDLQSRLEAQHQERTDSATALQARLDAQHQARTQSSDELHRKFDELAEAAAANGDVNEMRNFLTQRLEDHAQIVLETLQGNDDAVRELFAAQQAEQTERNTELHRKLGELAVVASASEELEAMRDAIGRMEVQLRTELEARYDSQAGLLRSIAQQSSDTQRAIVKDIALLRRRLDQLAKLLVGT